ncbi:MAG: hypothetical protein M1833_002051 [Piccolia ochrophora]|nr:MAG: hypothetical protein M1833_002051 [Piccolia ochrophora]
MPSPPYVDIAARKQAERESRIPEAWRIPSAPNADVLDVLDVPRSCGVLNARDLEITERYDAVGLAEGIKHGTLGEREVVEAFCKRAAVAHQVTNCLTEIFFDDALRRADWLAAELSRTGKPIGPLHGVPISLKDTFKVKDYDASIGIASLAFKPATENSVLVDLLLEAGAVLYCKTNVPQTLMALDSENNVFGRTLNPKNGRVTAGGSSGGEGALVAMRGSVLGVGTDIGGSIRIPAMCNGVYGFKPSGQRVPYTGQENGVRPGVSEIALAASAGPIAASLRDCELFMKVVAGARPWERDPSIAFGSWEQQGDLVSAKPVVGIARTDGIVTPLPPIARLLDEVVGKLRKAGVDVVEIDTSAWKKCQDVTNALFGAEGGNHMFDLLETTEEPLSTWLSPRLRRRKPLSTFDLAAVHAQKMQIEMEMLKIWKDPSTGKTIDAIICPVAPHPVSPIDRWISVNYTSSFVLLDYPAGTIPVRVVDEADLKEELSVYPISRWDKLNQDLWDMTTVDRRVYLGTSLSIQVVAPKLQERRLYQAMQLIDDAIKYGEIRSSKL